MTNIIEIKSLSFSYSKKNKILNNLSLSVPEGSIYGFLGQNGAGKSTTMSLISGLIPEPSNSIKLFNQPIEQQLPQAFSKIGSLIESPALYLHLSGYNNLKYIAKIKGINLDKIEEVLELIGLKNEQKKAAKNYSLGMKQRLAIGMALIGEPKLLLLDEPVNGLDPSGMKEIRNLLIKLNKEKGITIFISSHLLSEIEKMCTHIGIINKGEVVFEGTVKELTEKSKVKNIEITLNNAEHWVGELNNDPSIKATLVNETKVIVQIENSNSVPSFIKKLVNMGIEIDQFKVLDELEDLFMEITDTKTE
jgi:ABC-2 type transport system ATP-binding protein